MMYFVILFAIIIVWSFTKFLTDLETNKLWWKEFNDNPYNFPFKYKGKTLWYSRACAVAGFIFAKDEETGEWCILANQRGKGTPDFQGMWNCPCGFLSFNERGVTACARESYEECGLEIPEEKLVFLEVNDDPIDSNKQHVTLRYYAKLTDAFTKDMPLKATGLGEEDEVEERSWIPMSKIDNYEWAFGHKEIIKSIFERKILG